MTESSGRGPVPNASQPTGHAPRFSSARAWQLAHWARRWSARKTDWYMGRCIQGPQAEHVRLILKHVRPTSFLDVGAGHWKVLEFLARKGIPRLAGTELPVAAARVPPPPGIEAHVSESPWPLPWPDKTFDLAYQNNAVAAMAVDDIPHVVDEMCRVARLIAWGQGYEPRFWDKAPPRGNHAVSEWLLDVLTSRAKLVRVWPAELTIWRPL